MSLMSSDGKTICIICKKRIKYQEVAVTDDAGKTCHHRHNCAETRWKKLKRKGGQLIGFIVIAIIIFFGTNAFIVMADTGGVGIVVLMTIVLTPMVNNLLSFGESIDTFCFYCGKEFVIEEAKEQHELICVFNSASKFYRG